MIPILPAWAWIIIVIALIWSMFWKALGLWKAGKSKDKFWFVVLFLINTLGILELYYLYIYKE